MIKWCTIIMCWLYNIFTKCLQHALNKTNADFYKFDNFIHSATKELQLNWNLEIEKSKNPNLLKILTKTFGILPLIAGAIYSTIEMISHILMPLYVGGIVSYYATDKESVSIKEMHRSTVGLVAFALLTGFLYNPLKIYANKSGIKMRVACSSLIYEKSLNVKDHNIRESVLRLITDDVGNMDNVLVGIHHIWKTPFETFIIMYLMYREVGVPAIFGMLVMLTVIPMQTLVARLINDCEMHLNYTTDKRVSFVKEMINGIKMIKMYTWEKLFENIIKKLREREINVISQYTHLYSVVYSLNIIPRLAAFVTFTTFVLNGDSSLTSKHVFMISLYYQFLNISIMQSFPMALAEFLQAVNSIDRIQCFLLKFNGNKNQMNDLLKNRIHNTTSPEKGVILNNVSATWNQNIVAGIYSIDLDLQSNRIYGITGKLECGKSTLLNTIIAELEPNEGKIDIKGTISYGSQEPWLFNETIKQNIIFVEKFDDNRYKTVCRVCALDRDFDTLKLGDETIVEENGHSLSDELKSKINLARTIYREADIYLIDDPLCISNSQIGCSIYENGIQKFLKGKCVILVTNEIKYLKLVDQIITMENGHVKEIGKFDQSLFEKYSSVTRDYINYAPMVYKELKEKDDTVDGNSKEIRPISILQNYFRVLENTKLLGIAIALIFFTQVSMGGIDIFVSEWAKLQHNTTSILEFKTEALFEDHMLQIKPYLYMYAILIVAVGYLLFQRTKIMSALSLDISRTMHSKLYQVILGATLQLFDDSTSEKVIQSFSYDIKNIDLNLPMDLLDCLTFLAEVIFIIICLVTANRLLIIPSLAVCLLFYWICNICIKLSRHIANVESVHLNVIRAHLNSSIEGGSLIRAHNAESHFIDKFDKYQEKCLTITYFRNELILFTYVMDIVCCFFIIMVIVSFMFMNPTDITDSRIGLAISQVFILKGICQRGMQKSVEVEMRLSSVTKILNYCECEREPSATLQDTLPTTYKWPKYGKIVFKNVNLKGPENIINRLNFEVKPKEKIAILGDEKSLLIDTLIRFYEPECGSIKIDGFDIQKINLNNLRRNITIILQDPIIFDGTVRYNLDPLNERSNFEIMKLLHQIVSELALDDAILHLHNIVEHLNVRQKRIICMARALLRQNKIIIVDESTAIVDEEFSKILHRAIKKFCVDCTVITLANRLNHVMDCDRIIILNEGRLVEYDHPYNIIGKSNKYFKVLLENYDENQRYELINIAKENYKLL